MEVICKDNCSCFSFPSVVNILILGNNFHLRKKLQRSAEFMYSFQPASSNASILHQTPDTMIRVRAIKVIRSYSQTANLLRILSSLHLVYQDPPCIQLFCLLKFLQCEKFLRLSVFLIILNTFEQHQSIILLNDSEFGSF